MCVCARARAAHVAEAQAGGPEGCPLHSTPTHPGPLAAVVLETVVIEASGATVVAALENGVSEYPKLEGRFLQVQLLQYR